MVASRTGLHAYQSTHRAIPYEHRNARIFPADFSADVTFTEDLGGVTYSFSEFVSDPHDITVHPGPEPTSLTLMLAGLVALGLMLRRKTMFGRASLGNRAYA